jgi:hypothetical protein
MTPKRLNRDERTDDTESVHRQHNSTPSITCDDFLLSPSKSSVETTPVRDQHYLHNHVTLLGTPTTAKSLKDVSPAQVQLVKKCILELNGMIDHRQRALRDLSSTKYKLSAKSFSVRVCLIVFFASSKFGSLICLVCNVHFVHFVLFFSHE